MTIQPHFHAVRLSKKTMTSSHPIGIFDSGVGGLTVLRALRQSLPNEHFVYFADTANVPYGDKTPEQIKAFSRQIIGWMQHDLGVKLVIAACHTSSALALGEIASEFNIPLIGTIEPTVAAILQDTKHTRIGIIATPASANNLTHEKALRLSGYEGLVHTIPCRELVPLIEAGDLNAVSLHEHSERYLQPFHTMNLTTLIYGCTHYPWVADVITRYLPPLVACIDPAQQIVAQASQLLKYRQMVSGQSVSPAIDFYCSARPEQFAETTGRFLLMPPPKVILKIF